MTNRSLDLLAVFAHPDDETFRPGGTLALLARSGVRVHVLTATRGQAGSCGNPPLCTSEELPAVRENELRCACATLGLKPPRLLDYQDGHLTEVNFETLTAQVLAAISEIHPQVILTFGPDGLSGHPDHIVIGQCAARACSRTHEISALYTLAVPRSLEDQLEMLQVVSVPDQQIALRVDVASVWEVKRAAMACHATQRAATPIMAAPEAHQRLFFSQEFFVRPVYRHPHLDFVSVILKPHCR